MKCNTRGTGIPQPAWAAQSLRLPLGEGLLFKLSENAHRFLVGGKICFYDAKSRELLGSAEFKTGFWHTFADPPEIVDELIGRIYGEREGKYMK